MILTLSPSSTSISRKTSYINHISHIANIPNPEQVQYMNFAHSVAWTFSKEKKSIINYINFYNYSYKRKR